MESHRAHCVLCFSQNPGRYVYTEYTGRILKYTLMYAVASRTSQLCHASDRTDIYSLPAFFGDVDFFLQKSVAQSSTKHVSLLCFFGQKIGPPFPILEPDYDSKTTPHLPAVRASRLQWMAVTNSHLAFPSTRTNGILVAQSVDAALAAQAHGALLWPSNRGSAVLNPPP
jgi:hypothetical protein